MMDNQTIADIRAYLAEYDWLFNAGERDTLEWRERFNKFQNTSLLHSDDWLRAFLDAYDSEQARLARANDVFGSGER
jgi:hypothetical protein